MSTPISDKHICNFTCYECDHVRNKCVTYMICYKYDPAKHLMQLLTNMSNDGCGKTVPNNYARECKTTLKTCNGYIYESIMPAGSLKLHLVHKYI